MTANLQRRSGLRAKTQDLILRFQKPCEDNLGLGIRCLPQWAGHKKVQADDAVRRLTEDVDQLEAQNHITSDDMDYKTTQQTALRMKQLSDDVQMQLHRVLEVIKELTAERGERPTGQRHTSPEEAVELLEQFVAADLPVQLLAEIPVLQFEARKEVMNVCCALMWPGMPQQVDRQVLQYLQHHPRVFPLLIKGYDHEEAALHYGVVLRSCARHAELVDAFLQSGLVFELFRHVRNPSIDISSDAFYTLREVLLDHKEVSAPWLELHFQEFFKHFHGLLLSEDYIVQRQALTLLAAMLLDRGFKRVMLGYVNDDRHLQILMNLLRDPSRAIQAEAFHVFKIFVANPDKPPRIQQILYRNKEKLVKLVSSLESMRPDDKKFDGDQQNVLRKLNSLTPLVRSPNSKAGGAKASPASPSSPARF